MSKKNKIMIRLALFVILGVALFLVFILHSREQQIVKNVIAAEEKEQTMMEAIQNNNNSYADLYFKNIRDVDIKRGVYALETIVDMYGKKGSQFSEFNLNNGNINNKKVLTKETIGEMEMERQKLVSGHIFSAISICYPLDTQILHYEIVPKSKTYSDVIMIRKVDVNQEKLIAGYEVIKSGTVGKLIKENASDEQLGLRAFVVLRNNSFISFVKFNLMLIVAFIIAVISTFANTGSRFGMSLATVLITASSVGVSFNKIPDINTLTYVELAGVYYVFIFLAFFITTVIFVKIDKRESLVNAMTRHDGMVKKVEMVIAQHGSNEALENIKAEYHKDRAECKDRQSKLEQKLLTINEMCYLIVIMFGGFFMGSYFILTL